MQDLEHWLREAGTTADHDYRAESNGTTPESNAHIMLKQLGVTRLEPEHAMAVLSRRLW